ncbi:UNVERIFIED_CONTAM: hypothetical protein FKN15_030788 [Acipenser sinensis]
MCSIEWRLWGRGNFKPLNRSPVLGLNSMANCRREPPMCSTVPGEFQTYFSMHVTTPTQGYEFGSAIFIAWAGSFLVILGGAMLTCSCPRRTGGARKYPRTKSGPPSTTKEYV